jgi:hypothetical protein
MESEVFLYFAQIQTSPFARIYDRFSAQLFLLFWVSVADAIEVLPVR